jgi:hypothetical protein
MSEGAELLEVVDRDHILGARVTDVRLDADVGRSGQQHGVGSLGVATGQIVEILGAGEESFASADLAAIDDRRRRGLPERQRVVGIRGRQRVGGVLDRAVSGAPAQVSAQCVEVEAVLPEFAG